jgi:hypothetical protein
MSTYSGTNTAAPSNSQTGGLAQRASALRGSRPSTPKVSGEMLRYVAQVLAVLTFLAIAWAAQSKEWGQEQGKYLAPDVQEYYKTLKQPDNADASCCGDGDAYYTDKFDECLPTDGADCALVAIITDERPDELERPDGSKVHRPHIDVGTRIPIPRSKIRKHPIPNPTPHGIVFVNASYPYEGGEGNAWYGVYCYEPQPLI